jgi:hypothetical protein
MVLKTYIPTEKLSAMLHTAKDKLLDENVGIYNVFPMDFHILKEYLNFSGNEAGEEYYYFNGGIWPHGNAWYALGLMSIGKKDEALKFIRKVMTVKGIMNGPNGQPALYEVRNGNINDLSVYGTVDKPQFLWAAGWYLYSVYHLYGINENSWNISFDPFLNNHQSSTSFDIFLNGHLVNIDVTGKGSNIKYIKYGDQIYSSTLIPTEIPNSSSVSIELGKLEIPVVSSTNSVLLKSFYQPGILNFRLKAFIGHRNVSKIISPYKPVFVKINNTDYENWTVQTLNNNYEIEIKFNHSFNVDVITIEFDESIKI